MILSPNAENWLKTGLCEAIMLLCKSVLKFESQFSVDGLLAVTIDRNEVLLVNIKEVVDHNPPITKSALVNATNNNGYQKTTIIQNNCAKDDDTNFFNLNNSETSYVSNNKRKMKKSCKIPSLEAKINNVTNDDDKNNSNCDHTNIFKENSDLKNDCSDDYDDSEDNQNQSGNPGAVKNIQMTENQESNELNRFRKESFNNLSDQNFTELDQNYHSSINRVVNDDDNDDPKFDLSKVKVEEINDNEEYTNVSHNSITHSNDQLYNETWVNQLENDISGNIFSSFSIGRLKMAKQKPHFINKHSNTRQQQPQTFSYKRRILRMGCCENCGTTKTTAWRRSESKELLCNACGCYYKLHKVHRPLHMAHNEIRSRTRRVNTSLTTFDTTPITTSAMDSGYYRFHENQYLLTNP